MTNLTKLATTALIASLAALGGCESLSPRERAIGAGLAAIAVAGAIEANRHGHSDPTWIPGRGPGPAVRP